jgi:iron complex transport system permease protein
MSMNSSTPKRRAGLGWGLLGGVLVLFCSSLLLGASGYTPAELWQEPTILLYIRLPRTIGCLLAGAALAGAGLLLQSVLNNSLASPGIIGINSGAGLAVVIAAILFPGSVAARTTGAFLGAFLTVMLVYGIARSAGASRTTLVLSGVAVSNLFAAAIDAVVTFVPDALNGYSDFKIGGFSDVTMAKIVPAGGGILISLMLILTLSQQMDVLALGPETAQSLGLSVRPIRLLLLVLAAALCGAAISFSGLLGFVGLIVPHMMRRLVGEESLKLTFSCAMGGATLVALCDTLARIIFAPYELPVGIVLSFAGVPFFLWLLLRQRGGRISD